MLWPIGAVHVIRRLPAQAIELSNSNYAAMAGDDMLRGTNVTFTRANCFNYRPPDGVRHGPCAGHDVE
jgi:hypothetical protein